MMKAVKRFEDKLKAVEKRCRGKQVVLYGYGRSGRFLEWYYSKVCQHTFNVIMDDSLVLPCKSIHRKIVLEYLDSEETVILVTFRRERMQESMEAWLKDFGYVEGENIIFMKEEIVPAEISVYGWLEHEYGADLSKRIDVSEFDYSSKDATASGASRQMSIMDLFMAADNSIEPVLDYGCGKGAAMVLMRACGINEVDGIEYSEQISELARGNMELIGESGMNIFTGDAAKFTDIDKYHCFYLYDPFRGNTFRKVMDNIEESVERKTRDVTIIYANPWLHREVERNGVFRLTKQFESDFFLNLVNIYQNIQTK